MSLDTEAIEARWAETDPSDLYAPDAGADIRALLDEVKRWELVANLLASDIIFNRGAPAQPSMYIHRLVADTYKEAAA